MSAYAWSQGEGLRRMKYEHPLAFSIYRVAIFVWLGFMLAMAVVIVGGFIVWGVKDLLN